MGRLLGRCLHIGLPTPTRPCEHRGQTACQNGPPAGSEAHWDAKKWGKNLPYCFRDPRRLRPDAAGANDDSSAAMDGFVQATLLGRGAAVRIASEDLDPTTADWKALTVYDQFDITGRYTRNPATSLSELKDCVIPIITK